MSLGGILDGILGGGGHDGKNTNGPVENPGADPVGPGGGDGKGPAAGGGAAGGGIGGGGLLPSLSLSIGLPNIPSVSLPIGGASDSNPPSLSTSGPSLSLSSNPPSSLTSQQSSATPPPSAPPSGDGSSASPSATPTPPPSVSAVVGTDANGDVYTSLSTVFVSAPASSDAANAANNANAGSGRHLSFLENKPLSGAVFGLCGLVALVLLFILVTLTLRRRRRKRLLDEAVSFDPALLAAAERYDAEASSEKGHGHESNPSFGSNAAAAASGGGYDMYASAAAPAEYYGTRPAQAEYYAAPGGVGQAEYYEYGVGQGTNTGRQPYYSAYVPPMAGDVPPSTLGYYTQPQQPQQGAASVTAPQKIPRVPPPRMSDENNRRQSVEEAEFWARTLQVTNK